MTMNRGVQLRLGAIPSVKLLLGLCQRRVQSLNHVGSILSSAPRLH